MKKDGSLDRVDKELLYWLDLNCRDGLASLAKKMRTTPAKISYRMEQLVKLKAIHSFVTLIDYRKLGYRGYAAYFKLKEMSRKELYLLVEKILDTPNVVDVLLTTGTYDLQLVFLATSSDEASEGLLDVREKLGDSILEEVVIVNLRTHFFSRESFLEKNEQKPVLPRLVLDTPKTRIKLDKVDDAILSVIGKHAEWPLWKVAQAAKVAGPTVYNRIKKMEKNGVIVGYTIKMDSNLKEFYFYRVLVKLRHITQKRRRELLAYLDSHPRIYRSSFTFGQFDLNYDARVADDSELRELLGQVYEHFKNEVVRQDWVRVYEIIKFSFYIKNIELEEDKNKLKDKIDQKENKIDRRE